MKRIFISHISREAPLAIVIKDWIESSFAGQCKAFVSSDKNDLPPGSKWLNTLDEALDNAELFLVLCSPDSIKRPWINFETGCAWVKKVPVIPICHSEQLKDNLPSPLNEFQALEIEDENFVQELFDSLAKHLGFSKAPRIDQKAMMEAISSAKNNFGIILPEGIEEYSSGYDTFTLYGTLENPDKVTEDWEMTLTWNEIFAYLGTILLEDSKESSMLSKLSMSLKPLYKKYETKKLVSFEISRESFEAITTQLLALGLIAISEKYNVLKDEIVVWKLSNYGARQLQYLSELKQEEFFHKLNEKKKQAIKRL